LGDVRRRLVSLYLFAAIPALPAHFLLPQPWSALALLWLSVLAVAAVGVGVHFHRPRDKRPWLLLGTGVGLFLVGQLAWHLERVSGALPPIMPSLSDVFSIAAYPVLASAAVLFIRAHQPRYRLTAAIDALVVGVAGVLILWLVVIENFIHDSSLGLAERAVLVAYPVGDAMLLSAAVYLLLSGRKGRGAFHLLFGAFTALLAADVIRAVSTANAATTAGADLLSLISFLLLGLTALVPTMYNLTEPSDEPSAPERGRRLVLLGAAILILPTFALAQYQAGRVNLPLILVATVLLVVAILARMNELVAVHQRTQLRFASLLANASDAFAIVRADGTFSYASPASERVLGRAPAAIQDRPALRLVHPRDRHVLRDALASAASGPGAQAEVEVETRRGDGAWRWLSITLTNRTDDPMVNGIVLNYRDVTEGRESQRRAELQARLLDEVQHAVAVTDSRSRVIYWNRAAEQMFGWRATEVMGTPLRDLNLTANETERTSEITAALKSGGRWSGEFELRRRDGSRLTALVGNTALLAPGGRIKGLIAVAADISERKQLEQRLQKQAFSDALTGLANRPLFLDRISHLLRRQPRSRSAQFAVLFLDIDDFKTVNDTMGHSAGDELLIGVARRLVGALRPGDTAARLGGDEFAVLLEDAGQEEAVRVARRLLADLTQPLFIAGKEVIASTSIGIVVPSQDIVTSAEDLLRNADLAMYGAKMTTRGSYAVYEPGMHTAAVRRIELRADLETALDEGALRLEYQPILRLSDGAAMGAEALVCWPHPERGDVPMPETMALAEGAGLIPRLGQWVLDQACWQAKSWRDSMGISRGNALPFVSVNASVRELLDGNYPDRIASTLSRSGLPPAALVIEVSESALMQDPDSTVTALVRLKALGVRLTIDGFGTGYSSLSHLARFPLDTAKIDRSFVAATLLNHDWTVARSIMNLARSMKLEVVAEGIEQIDEASAMIALGADYGQGAHLAPAATGDGIQKVLMVGAIMRGAASPRPTGQSLVEAVAGGARRLD